MPFRVWPAGRRTTAFEGIQARVSDPLDAAEGYVYLFEQDGTLDPSAGVQYVNYTFSLNSGDYKTTYKFNAGPNPENSSISTAYYVRHFADRWKDDGLWISAGAATNVDILDRHKNLFAPGVCGRSEDTFSNGEGAFIINKSGPVRAIRSFVGANSGPRTQQQHLYYEQREDIATFLRVHEIPGVMDFFDYSAAAIGMIYRNNNNTAGVTIDGVADTVTAGGITWELVAGGQGALVMAHGYATTIPGFSRTSYYLDATAPGVTQCTGDAYAYGSSGDWVNIAIPNTDPVTAHVDLAALRTIYFAPPETTVSDAETFYAFAETPLVAACRLWGEGEGEGEGESSHSADHNGDSQISLSELLRVIQFFNSDGYHCDLTGEEGYNPGGGDRASCAHHASDYNPADWRVDLSELLRLIQFFNSGGYHACTGSEDGFCPGLQ